MSRPLSIALIQLRTGIDPASNLSETTGLLRQAAAAGAQFVATPEMTNILDIRPGGSDGKVVAEAQDLTLAALRDLARELGIWLLIGSLAIQLTDESRKANRSFLLDPEGEVKARYDKIHMFDVDVGDGQSYRESRTYRPGRQAILAPTPFATLGLTICYDLRFPNLYRTLAQAGAEILLVPAAFTRVTGAAHWHTLLKSRAIETGCFVIAPAQGGKHEDGRQTFGHSLVVSPWGEIVGELETDTPGILRLSIDLDEVAAARARIPALQANPSFSIPD